jgi:PIN domain nuclease of toxin-antitoxin system
VTILDAQALVALLAREPAAPEVARILRDPDTITSVPATALAEVVDVLVRRMGNRVEHVSETLDTLIASGVEVVPLDQEIGRLAGILRSRHWNHDRRPVSLADCVVLATGMTIGEPIATADAALIGAARAEGHPVVALPDSRGQRPA